MSSSVKERRIILIGFLALAIGLVCLVPLFSSPEKPVLCVAATERCVSPNGDSVDQAPYGNNISETADNIACPSLYGVTGGSCYIPTPTPTPPPPPPDYSPPGGGGPYEA